MISSLGLRNGSFRESLRLFLLRLGGDEGALSELFESFRPRLVRMVTLRLDAAGRIKEIAHETAACVLAQASASILGAHLEGADASSVRRLRADVSAMLSEGMVPAPPFADYSALKGAAVYRNRHTCVLLPIDAVLDALGAAKTA